MIIYKQIHSRNGDASKPSKQEKTISPSNKKKVSYAETAKKDLEISEVKLQPLSIKSISNSKWQGRKLLYLVSFDDESWEPRWLEAKDFSAPAIVCSFHSENPNAPKQDDYDVFNDWKIVQRKQRYINRKIELKKPLTKQDIDFIAHGINLNVETPKEFVRLHYKITNKKILRRCSYLQKIKVIAGILNSYGLSGVVTRISFIGDSVLEIYMQAQSRDLLLSRME